MVYNALKLFMEINPTLFDECTNNYKLARQQCVVLLIPSRRQPVTDHPVLSLALSKGSSRRSRLDTISGRRCARTRSPTAKRAARAVLCLVP